MSSQESIDGSTPVGEVATSDSQTSEQTPVATPEITPSRRSARKKQSTFSSDFEYYTPTGRKKEVNPEECVDGKKNTPASAGKRKQGGKGQKKAQQEQEDGENGEDEEEEEKEDSETPKKGVTKKVAVRKPIGKAKKQEEKEDEEGEDEEEEEEEDEEKSAKKAVKKKTAGKGSVKLKAAAKKLAKAKAVKAKGAKGGRGRPPKKKEEEEEDEEEENDEEEKSQKAGAKRKKGAGKGPKGKKAKAAETDSSSDEEDSTPISQLKAQMSADKAKTQKPMGSVSSPIAQNLMKKLKEASTAVLSSPEKGIKRKQNGDEEDAPKKKMQPSPKKGAQGKNLPPSDAGLIKRTAAEILAKAGFLKKPVQQPTEVKEEDTAEIPEEKVKSQPTPSKKPGDIESKANDDAKSTVKKEALDSAKKVVKKSSSEKVKNVDGKSVSVLKMDVEKKVKVEPGKKVVGSVKVEGSKKTSEDVTKDLKDQIITLSTGEKGVIKMTKEGKKMVLVRKKVIGEDGKIQHILVRRKPELLSKQLPDSVKKLLDGEKKAPPSGEKKPPTAGEKKPSAASEAQKKPSQNVEDLLKRHVVKKKKSHQPFGNKKTPVKHTVKDANQAAVKDSPTKTSGKKPEGKRKSSDSLKARNRSISKDSGKVERRRSSEGSKKGQRRRTSSTGPEKKEEEEGPPPLLTPGKPAKLKHKVEHEVPVDLTMMDLFKPDGVICHEKKEEETPTKNAEVQDEKKAGSPMSPQWQQVMIEHQYSKPSSPTSGVNSNMGQQQDIASVSHKILMDSSLPDQILDDSAEEATDEQMVSKKDAAGERSCILESLDSELKESGTDFLIVGQVEVGRAGFDDTAVPLPSESVTMSTVPSKKVESLPPPRKRKESEKSTDTRKSSTDSRRSSLDKASSAKKKKKHKIRDDKKAAGGEKRDGEESEEDEEEGFQDDENDLDWDDPDVLYCICRKPHNNRFMICCDKCEEWYHGTCVGISRQKGKEMEENEEDYICPVCSKGDQIKSPAASKSQTMDKPSTPKPADKTPSKPKVVAPKCVARKCEKPPRGEWVYCSHECIMIHAQDSLKAIREEQMRKKMQERQESGKSASKTPIWSSSDPVDVIERKTGKTLKGSNAPTQKNLHRWLEQHPTYEVLRHSKHRSGSSKEERGRDRERHSDKDRRQSSDKDQRSVKVRSSSISSSTSSSSHHHHHHHSNSDKSRRESTGGSSSSSKTSVTGKNQSDDIKRRGSGEDGPNEVRLNVRKALRDSLTARAKEADDILLSSGEIKSLSMVIEEELYNLFADTGHKYRTKYRSLVFNIKDPKNKGLFRKILTGKIKPSKLVLMSTEELANRELAQWREKESKHQLEMIEQTEKEALKESQGSKPIRKKTHKGEVEVEDEDLSILETRLEEPKDKGPEEPEETELVPVIDTTDQHRAHLFDLNCKVCTGKIVPAPEEQAAQAAAAAKVKVVHFEEKKEEEEDNTPVDKEDYIKAEEIVKETITKMQNASSELSALPSISQSPSYQHTSPPLSPKLDIPLDDVEPTPVADKSTGISSSPSSESGKKKVVVRSPDSALQSGLEAKSKFTPTGPMLWKGFVSMLDVAKFFTSAYRVSGPTDHITIPDTIHIMGRISPDHMWDYLSKIRQAGSKDLTVIRFIPGSDDEKVAYVHLYSYLNSRSRCGVAGNPNKQIKDFYVVPLASHSKIPRTLLPFDGPGLEENRPHMLIGILVRQRGKHSDSNTDQSSNSTSSSKSSNSHSSKHGSSKKEKSAPVNRDPRLAKLQKPETSPKVSPSGSTSSTGSTNGSDKGKPQGTGEEESEYVPLPVKITASKTVAEYIPTSKKKDEKKDSNDTVSPKDGNEKHNHHRHHHHDKHDKGHHHHPPHHHHHHHEKKEMKVLDDEDDEPYSPGKEAEPYSPGQEAQADEPYDPADETLMDDTGVPIVSSSTPIVADKSSPSITATSSILTSSSASSSTTIPSEALGPNSVKPSLSSTGSALSTVSTTTASEVSTKVSHSSPVVQSQAGKESIPELVEQMAASNDPTEISSLMVKALASASTPQQQQKLLVQLTKQVEERKLQLAEASRKGIAPSTTQTGPVAKPSVSITEGTLNKNPVTTAGSVFVSSSAPVTEIKETDKASSDTMAQSSGKTNVTVVSSSVSPVTPSVVPSVTPVKPSRWDQSEKQSSSSSSSSILPTSEAVSLPASTSTDTSSASSVPASTSSTTPTAAPNVKFSIIKSTGVKHLSTKSDGAFTDTKPESAQATLPGLDQTPGSLAGSETEKASSVIQPSKDIPDALKALMQDMMGNSQLSSLEKRTKMLMKKEAEKQKEEKKVSDSAVTEEKSEEGKESIEESQTSSAGEVIASSNNSSTTVTDGESTTTSTTTTTATTTATEESKPSAPSIDELLERLKKGGFKVPVSKPQSEEVSSSVAAGDAQQEKDSTSHPTTSTTTASPLDKAIASFLASSEASAPSISSSSSSSSSSLSSASLATTTTSSPSVNVGPSVPSPLPSLPQVSSTSLAIAASQDVDLRQPQPARPPLPGPAFGDYDARLDRDDRLPPSDNDGRLPPSMRSLPPKHPLDPRAFPPLPGDTSHGYGPPPHPHPSDPRAHLVSSPGHGALHPRFPLPPSMEPPMAPHRGPPMPPHRPALIPKGRAQPPPPGTEFEKPAKVLGITDNFPPSDVDMRASQPPLPPEQPPLPPQPPPPLPPLPASMGGPHHPPLPPPQYPLPPPPRGGDMDYRGSDYPPDYPPEYPPDYPPSHHYRDRPDYRHGYRDRRGGPPRPYRH